MSNQQWNSGQGSGWGRPTHDEWGQSPQPQASGGQEQPAEPTPSQSAQEWAAPQQPAPSQSAQEWAAPQQPAPSQSAQEWAQPSHPQSAQEWAQPAQPQQQPAQQWGQPQWGQPNQPASGQSAQGRGSAPTQGWGQQPPQQEEWGQTQIGQSWGQQQQSWDQTQPQAQAQQSWDQAQPPAQAQQSWDQNQQGWGRQQTWAQGVQQSQPAAPAVPKASPFDLGVRKLSLPDAAGLIFMVGAIALIVEWLFGFIAVLSSGNDFIAVSSWAILQSLIGGLAGVVFKLLVLRVLVEIGVAATRLLGRSDDKAAAEQAAKEAEEDTATA